MKFKDLQYLTSILIIRLDINTLWYLGKCGKTDQYNITESRNHPALVWLIDQHIKKKLFQVIQYGKEKLFKCYTLTKKYVAVRKLKLIS